MASRKKPDEINLVRIYDAPVQAVWDAWTDPEQVAQWWGPRGFTLTTHSKDLRVGGHWTYTMHGPDGTDYPNTTVYHEVVECQRLVYDHGGSDDSPPLFRVTVSFNEVEGKTRMEMTMRCASPEETEAIRQRIKQAGGNTTWDRLAEYLADESKGKDIFVINRSFAASIETVYEMWVNPEHLARWLGPAGSSTTLLSADVREGGHLRYAMGGMHGQLHYKRIVPPHLLVYTQNFCDENGKLEKPAFAPTWPDSMLTTVVFTEEGPDQTRITLTWEIHGAATEIERKTFHDAKPGMSGGWTGSFDKLEAQLES